MSSVFVEREKGFRDLITVLWRWYPSSFKDLNLF
jgi:hypothetical protein